MMKRIDEKTLLNIIFFQFMQQIASELPSARSLQGWHRPGDAAAAAQTLVLSQSEAGRHHLPSRHVQTHRGVQ